MTILIAILVFCVIIIIHELGHFVAAKLCGIQVNEFALGMGPVIFRKQGKETAYVIRLLPIGGSVSMEGEDGTSDNPRAFNRKPIWQRMIVIVAGAVMNLVLGFFVVMISLGLTENVATTTVSSFREQAVSSQQLMVGDRITKIDGLTIFTSSDIIYKLQSGVEQDADGNAVFDFTVERDGAEVLLEDVTFATTVKDGKSSIYFDFTVLPMEKTFFSMISESFRETCSTGRLIIMTLFDMLRGRYGINDLSGPVGVVQVVSDSVAKYDISVFFSVISLITINVGVFNLLPIPALDGCRFLFLIIEAIRRKPVKPEVEGMVHFAGFALLMILMLVVTFNDIIRLVNGG